ncbi:hypothetical protein HDU91_002988, partial [Kappamyces sp. JEL0680]
MSALDKLLQSNELNFAFLAFIPTLLITYSALSYLRSWTGSASRMRVSSVCWSIKLILRDMERLALLKAREDEEIGQLIVNL